MDSYCVVGDCEEPTREGRTYCELHEKRRQRGQSLTAPKQERLHAKARLIEAALQLADADPEDDAEYRRREQALLRSTKSYAPRAAGELVRQGMAQARRRGVRLGRPPALTAEEALSLLKQYGTATKAAEAAGVSRWALYRALARVAETRISHHAA